MTTTPDPVPDDTAALKAALIETRAKLVGAQTLIEHLQLVIAKMKRELFGPRSERSQRLLDQLELQLEELAAAAGEDKVKAETAGSTVQGFLRRKTRRNFPDHLLRRRIVHPAPTCCPCCGSSSTGASATSAAWHRSRRHPSASRPARPTRDEPRNLRDGPTTSTATGVPRAAACLMGPIDRVPWRSLG